MEEIKEIKQLISILKTKEKDMGLEKASREMGISFQTIWNWMEAKHKPSQLALTQLRKFIKKHEDDRTRAALAAKEN